MADFGVSSERLAQLSVKMKSLRIFEKDIEESFVHSSGPGGQNVNKVATCVVLKHHPTGIVIKYQKYRTQGSNRFWARCQLVEKVQQQKQNEKDDRKQAIAKKRRQNRKRSKLAKEKMLENKKQNSQRKDLRRKIRPRDVRD